MCIVRFSPTCDMTSHSMAKRRYFVTFCLDLLYNFLALVYRSIKSGAYSTKVRQYDTWLLDLDNTSISHFDTGMEWFQYHPRLFAIPQRVCTVELLSPLARIQRSRVLYTYELVVDDGCRNNVYPNQFFYAGVVIQASVCAMNECKRRTYKRLQQVRRCSSGETFEGYEFSSQLTRRHKKKQFFALELG